MPELTEGQPTFRKELTEHMQMWYDSLPYQGEYLDENGPEVVLQQYMDLLAFITKTLETADIGVTRDIPGLLHTVRKDVSSVYSSVTREIDMLIGDVVAQGFQPPEKRIHRMREDWLQYFQLRMQSEL